IQMPLTHRLACHALRRTPCTLHGLAPAAHGQEPILDDATIVSLLDAATLAPVGERRGVLLALLILRGLVDVDVDGFAQPLGRAPVEPAQRHQHTLVRPVHRIPVIIVPAQSLGRDEFAEGDHGCSLCSGHLRFSMSHSSAAAIFSTYCEAFCTHVGNVMPRSISAGHSVHLRRWRLVRMGRLVLWQVLACMASHCAPPLSARTPPSSPPPPGSPSL